jgi:hypothetical protein
LRRVLECLPNAMITSPIDSIYAEAWWDQRQRARDEQNAWSIFYAFLPINAKLSLQNVLLFHWKMADVAATPSLLSLHVVPIL